MRVIIVLRKHIAADAAILDGLSAIRKSASTAPDQICDIRLGQDVTLAYLKGKDAESEEAQEHATAAAWRCMRKTVQIKKSHSGRSLANNAWISRSHLYPR